MRSTNGRSLSMVIIAVAMLAQPASAQRGSVPRRTTAAEKKSTPTADQKPGFTLGVHTIAAMGMTVSGADWDGSLKTNFGPGAGVSVGYGFNRTFTAFALFDLAKQGASGDDVEGSLGLTHLEVGGRMNLPYGSPENVPYVMASYGRRTLSARAFDDDVDGEIDVSLIGSVFGLGAGIQHILSPTVTLDGGAELGFGRFSRAEIDGINGPIDLNGNTSVRLRFGVQWRPGSRRSS